MGFEWYSNDDFIAKSKNNLKDEEYDSDLEYYDIIIRFDSNLKRYENLDFLHWLKNYSFDAIMKDNKILIKVNTININNIEVVNENLKFESTPITFENSYNTIHDLFYSYLQESILLNKINIKLMFLYINFLKIKKIRNVSEEMMLTNKPFIKNPNDNILNYQFNNPNSLTRKDFVVPISNLRNIELMSYYKNDTIYLCLDSILFFIRKAKSPLSLNCLIYFSMARAFGYAIFKDIEPIEYSKHAQANSFISFITSGRYDILLKHYLSYFLKEYNDCVYISEKTSNPDDFNKKVKKLLGDN